MNSSHKGDHKEHSTTHKHTETEKKKPETHKKHDTTTSPRRAFFSSHKKKIVISLVLFLVAFGLVTREVYKRPVSDGFVRAVASVIPYPAITLNGTTVSIKEYLNEYDALVSFFSADESAPSDQELEDAISETLVNKIAVRQLADEYGVEIDEGEAENYYQGILSGQESEEVFAEELEETFGWTTEEFKENIVDSIVLALQMHTFVLENDEIQKDRQDAMNAAYARVQSGEDFAQVAKDVHAAYDDSVESDLGYVKLSSIPSAWAQDVEDLQIGEYTEMLELEEGFAIFLVNDSIVAGEDTQLHLLAITVQKQTLEKIVEEFVEASELKNYID